MSTFAFRITVAVLLMTMFALLSVIGKPIPEQRAKQAQGTPAVAAQTAPAKPIDPTASYEKYKREAQERQEREAKFDAVRRGEISFCEAFKSGLQEFTGIQSPCVK